MPYLKQYIRLVLYRKSEKSMDWLPVLENAYFSHLFRHFRPKIFFLAKLAMPYLKQYIRLVTYQKSEKSMFWLPRNAKNAYFSHLFHHFWQNIFFSSKIWLRSSLVTIKSYLDTKNQKNYGAIRAEPIRTDGRTDGRKDRRMSAHLQSLPNFLGQSKNVYPILPI